MTAHQITVLSSSGGRGLAIQCSCGQDLTVTRAHSTSLTQINDIAHCHIEAADRDEGYRTKSAITSEDQLVDIETGLHPRDLRNDTAWTGSTYGTQHAERPGRSVSEDRANRGVLMPTDK